MANFTGSASQRDTGNGRALRGVAGFAGDHLEFHSPVRNLANLQLKKPAHKIRVAPGENNLRPAGGIVHRDDIGAETVPDIVILGHHTFTRGHDPLKFPEVDDHVGFLKPTHGSVHNFPGTVLELLVNHFPLDLADPLVDGLACRLRGNASEVFRGHLDFEFLTKLGIGFDRLGFRQKDLIMRVRNFLNRNQLGQRPNRAALGVDLNAKLTGARRETLLGRGQEGGGNRLDQNFTLDAFFTLEVIEHRNEF